MLRRVGYASGRVLDPATRATTLATVVLARRALGEPYEGTAG